MKKKKVKYHFKILRHWLYGEVINDEPANENTDKENVKKFTKKGWFPYKCVRVIAEHLNHADMEETDEQGTLDQSKEASIDKKNE